MPILYSFYTQVENNCALQYRPLFFVFSFLLLIRLIGPISLIFPQAVCSPAFFPLLFYAQSVIIPRMQIFNILFVDPVINLLVLLYKGFAFVNLPGALGWSIISITVAIRLAVNPLMKRQIEQSQKENPKMQNIIIKVLVGKIILFKYTHPFISQQNK